MLSSLIFFLFFESAQPSYATLRGLLPEKIIIEAAAEAARPQNSPPMRLSKKMDSLGPVVEAESIYSMDLAVNQPLLVRNVFERRPIASIAKLITAMVILDDHAMNEEVTVSRHAANQEPSKMWLKPGEVITVENLLTGLLISSANDAAVALAQYDAGSEEAFVKKMNAKARELHLDNTHFSNVMGFDEPANYSTALDTMTFARAALEYAFIRKTVGKKTDSVGSISGDVKHPLETTNELLGNEFFHVIGLKTGHTPAAGQSFVSLAKAHADHEILTIVLNSPARFKETKIILDWILRNFEFETRTQ